MALTADVVVAGGGVIGTAIAWRASLAGLDVILVDPGCGEAASLVAAGMLAPASESLLGEEALLALNLLAAERFAPFVGELEEAAGLTVGLRREGTLAVAFDAADHAALVRLTAFRRSLGLDVTELDGRSCRRLEPFLVPDVRGGFLFESDWSVDNRRYLTALRQAMRAAGARAVSGRVTEVRSHDGQVTGVQLAADGPTAAVDGAAIECAAVVVAAGSSSAAIAGVPGPLRGAVRPVKGQLLRLRHPDGMPPVLGRTVRALVRGSDVYLVPRAAGEIVLGATSEERGPDRTVTAGAVHDLLRDALAVLPVLSELILAETCAGLRPGTSDNGPIVGETDVTGLLMATGHYRNGILLSPLTADAVAALLTGQRPGPQWEPFAPGRFAPGRLARVVTP
ncbi:MAG TPA: glycine oxidase ThiO [Streptosporangiaceae bacterium]|nr:glycine oxidase ThiO [Streptosporangiaceae bacterium]